jgi:acetyl-CoA acetyltransferase family protein
MSNIVMIAGKRTAFGSYGGGLSQVSGTELAVTASRGCLEQTGLKAEQIDNLVFGNVIQSEVNSAYSPRHIGLKLGIPQHIPALGVNRLCGSGFEAWVQGAYMLASGDASLVLAGGVEQMSMTPYVLRKSRFQGYRMGHAEIEDYLTSALTDSYANTPMAITAENLAVKYSISRDACDEYSILTQSRCKAALDKNVFNQEIISHVIEEKGDKKEFNKDEHPKPQVTLEKLKTMKPVFKKDGVVTAATASGIVDGAAASLLTTESHAKKLGVKPLAKILGWASCGCDPTMMGIGPAYAIPKALQKAGLQLSQMDLIEVNEAFAAQFLAVQKELNLPMDRTNVNGGAIAIGHPLAASGTRIMNHLVYELHRRQARYAVGSACIGGGQGIAVVIERI